MLNTKLALLFLTTLFLSSASYKTTLEPAIKKIEFAHFDVNSPVTKQKNNVEVFLYALINAKGAVQTMNRDEWTDSVSCEQSQLSASQLKSLTGSLLKKTPLPENMVRRSMKDGVRYAGHYCFLSITYQNNKTDNLCFIDEYMSASFQKGMNVLEGAVYNSNNKKVASFSVPESFKTLIQAHYSKSNYLPPIEFPPPAM